MTAKKNPRLNLVALSLGLSIELAMAIGIPVQAKPLSPTKGLDTNIQQTWEVSQFNPPDRGAPDVTTIVGGASRGECGERIIPLLPKDSSGYNFGLAVTDRPTLFWYVKESREQRVQAYFDLMEFSEDQGKDGSLVYTTSFNLPTTPGVVSINLPPEATLEVGKTYRWYMELYCDSNNAIDFGGLKSGWIERTEVTPILSSQLARTETPRDRAQLYAQNGIWFDAINILAQARRLEDTPALTAQWEALLQAVEAPDGVAKAPLMDCCSVKPPIGGLDLLLGETALTPVESLPSYNNGQND